MTSAAKAQLVKALAREVGFDLVGITRAAPIRRATYYREWLAKGYGGSMHYLSRNVHLRSDPARLLAGAQSILCVAVAYRRTDGYERPCSLGTQDGPAAARPPAGRIAQYARGSDYHGVLRGLLEQVLVRLRQELHQDFGARAFVDTGPLLERELAAAAGLGWIGKNTCLLNAHWGSYLLLGEIVTTLALPPDQPVPGRCGSCTRCLDTCPTQALVRPHQINAARCIAYLTMEHRAAIAPELHAALGDRLFGCDLCQQVCPYNARAPLGTQPEITTDRVPQRLPLMPLLALRSADFRRLTRDTALGRARRNMWRRNAALLLGNADRAGAEAYRALEALRQDSDPIVREAAAASLARWHAAPPAAD